MVRGGRDSPRTVKFFSLPEMRYQSAYVWLVFVSALDILLTLLVLYLWEGEEANPIARSVIHQRGFVWVIAYKFAMMLVAVIACEVVGRISDRAGRRLAVVAVIINGFPVALTFALLMLVGPPPFDVAEVAGGVGQ